MIFLHQEKLTKFERLLIDDIIDIQYGEIYDVTVDDGPTSTKPSAVTSQQMSLVNLIRNGVQSFTVIKVHQSEPAYAEVLHSTRSGRFKCKKLYKLN